MKALGLISIAVAVGVSQPAFAGKGYRVVRVSRKIRAIAP